MKKKHMKKIISVLLAAALGIFAGCGSSSDETASTEASEENAASSQDEQTDGTGSDEEIVLRVAYMNTSVWNAAFDVAYQAGFYDEIFADSNVSLEVVSFEKGTEINEAFLAGEIDIAYGIGDQPVVTALSAGQLDVEVLATTCVNGNLGIVVAPDSDITSVEDLTGKSISVYVGTNAHKALLQILEEYGISESDVELVNLSAYDEMITALNRGEIDAAFVGSYTLTTVEDDGLGTILATAGDHPVYSYVEVTREFAETYEEVVELFLDATVQGQEYLEENPEEGYQLISDFTGVDAESVKNSVEPIDFSVVLTEAAVQNLYDTSAFLYEHDLITEEVPDDVIEAAVGDFLEITE